MTFHVVLATNIYSFFRSFLRWLNVLMTLYFNRVHGSLVRSFIHPFFHPSTHSTTFYLCFFFFKFSQQDTSTPTQRPVEPETLLKPPQTGDRSASATSVTATEEPRSEVILHVSRSISPPSFKWFTEQPAQPGPLKFSRPMTAYVRNEGGCLILSSFVAL